MQMLAAGVDRHVSTTVDKPNTDTMNKIISNKFMLYYMVHAIKHFSFYLIAMNGINNGFSSGGGGGGSGGGGGGSSSFASDLGNFRKPSRLEALPVVERGGKPANGRKNKGPPGGGPILNTMGTF